MLLAAFLIPFSSAAVADLQLLVLKTKTGTFTNVTVMNRSATDIYISHSQGIGNVKISTIEDDDVLRALGLKVEPRAAERSSSTNSPGMIALSDAKAKLRSIPAAAPLLAKLESLISVPPPPKILAYAGATLFVIYLFFCFCLKLICRKAGSDPGPLVWLPVFQMIPTFRAAGMSGWWFVAGLIPVLNLLAGLLWCFKIVQARGKGVLVTIALLLPITNLLAFLYLAFSSAVEMEEELPKISTRLTPLGEA